MPRKQSQMFYHRPQRRSSRSSRGSTGIVGIVFAIFILVFGLGLLIQFLRSSSGMVFVTIVILTIVAFLVWRKRKRENQKQMWLMQQQQQAAWQQYRQQEAARQLSARQEWEWQERERQEQERIARMRSLGDILVLTPREFEEFTMRILEHNGIRNLRHTGGSGDLGADLIGFDLSGNQIVVQCKRYAPGNSIGSVDIQKFIGMMNVHHRAQKGIFVTTTIFTKPAIELASLHNISLIDGTRLIKLLQGVQHNSP